MGWRRGLGGQARASQQAVWQVSGVFPRKGSKVGLGCGVTKDLRIITLPWMPRLPAPPTHRLLQSLFYCPSYPAEGMRVHVNKIVPEDMIRNTVMTKI